MSEKVTCVVFREASISVAVADVNRDERNIVVTSNDRPLPALEELRQELVPMVANLFGWTKKWREEHKLAIHRVVIKHGSNGSIGAKISFRGKVVGGVDWTSSTPLVTVVKEEGDKLIGSPISDDIAMLIPKFAEAALDYFSGKRSQQSFLDDLDPEPELEDEALPGI